MVGASWQFAELSHNHLHVLARIRIRGVIQTVHIDNMTRTRRKAKIWAHHQDGTKRSMLARQEKGKGYYVHRVGLLSPRLVQHAPTKRINAAIAVKHIHIGVDASRGHEHSYRDINK